MQSDEVMPEGKWTFDDDVTEVFDEMLERSIPQYDVMRKSVFDLACKYRQRGTTILDLGASRGEAIAPFVRKFGMHNQYACVEISSPMYSVLLKRFKGSLDNGLMTLWSMDLREEFPPCSCSVILSILTIQFTPIEYRMKILREVYKHLQPGGAFIFVEKVLGNGHEINEMMVETYHDMKKDNGYTQDQIDRKKLSLEGVLVPVTASMNEELLRSAGFTCIDCFWRWMNFAGWIAIRD